jgi:hypothetical protein
MRARSRLVFVLWLSVGCSSDERPASATAKPAAGDRAVDVDAKPRSPAEALEMPVDEEVADDRELVECPDGGCEVRCDAGRPCRSSCDGGGCTQVCPPQGICSFDCIGGGCTQTCEPAAACRLSCTPGDCKQITGGAQANIDNTKPLGL